MKKALIYWPNNRRLTWFAFACAIAIHLGAIAIAENKPRPVPSVFVTDISDVTGTDNSSDESPPIEDVLPPDQVLPPPDEDAFQPENSTPPPVHAHRKRPIASIQSTNVGSRRATGASSAKALTLYAPKPNYPYEARRGGITGTGIAQLTVNVAAGYVTEARMAQSTGNAILDNATLAALKRWRFKPGVAENVDVPITYTLSGVSY
jgi:TonB family protein